MPSERTPNYYEFEDDDYATFGDAVPKPSRESQDPAGATSAQSSCTNPSTNVCQTKKTPKVAAKPIVNSKGNLGQNDMSSEDPYYHSLEETVNENIYDRVTEEPQDHVYEVLEKTI